MKYCCHYWKFISSFISFTLDIWYGKFFKRIRISLRIRGIFRLNFNLKILKTFRWILLNNRHNHQILLQNNSFPNRLHPSVLRLCNNIICIIQSTLILLRYWDFHHLFILYNSWGQYSWYLMKSYLNKLSSWLNYFLHILYFLHYYNIECDAFYYCLSLYRF